MKDTRQVTRRERRNSTMLRAAPAMARQDQGTASSQSLMIPIAREIDAELRIWLPKLRDAGEIDAESIQRMAALRVLLLSTPIANVTDAAIVIGTLRNVADFVHACVEDVDDLDLIKANLVTGSTTEMLIGLANLMEYIEGQGGHSPASLGLYQIDSQLN